MTTSLLYGCIIGVFIAVVVVCMHILCTAIKNEYYEVGREALPLRDADPELYAAMYRAKQHARNVHRPPLAANACLRQRALHLFASYQPDLRYLRLERNLTKLALHQVADHKRKSTLSRCRKDLAFLEDAPVEPRRRGFVVGMILGLLQQLVLPEREGPTEPTTPTARQAVKRAIELRLAAYDLSLETS
jgi:hypothetical protein